MPEYIIKRKKKKKISSYPITNGIIGAATGASWALITSVTGLDNASLDAALYTSTAYAVIMSYTIAKGKGVKRVIGEKNHRLVFFAIIFLALYGAAAYPIDYFQPENNLYYKISIAAVLGGVLGYYVGSQLKF